jgi:hypothetical protein
MEEPFDQATARRCMEAILEGPGMTVFTGRVKEEFMANNMTSADAVNVQRDSAAEPNELVLESAWRNTR